MNVLSLFDGIACGRLALERGGFKINNFFASEVDEHAIKVVQSNWPDVIQLGDVKTWKEWNLPQIDLLIGGSPCQGFSYAGERLNFDDSRSRLFFDFVDILNAFKPKFFLLENVKMKKETQDIISNYLGVEPMEINSALVSAQNRKRLYWFNWQAHQPEDKKTYLKDIIESKADTSLYINSKHKLLRRTERNSKGWLDFIGGFPKNDSSWGSKETFKFSQGRRVYGLNGKSITLSANGGGWGGKTGLYEDRTGYIRKLTETECEILQTIPKNYTEGIKKPQRYKLIGNAWTVDVVSHLLKYMNSSAAQ